MEMEVRYSYEGSQALYQIVYITRDGTKLVAGFYDEPKCRAFYNKLVHSRKVTILRYPIWK